MPTYLRAFLHSITTTNAECPAPPETADSLRHSVRLLNQARATGRVATCHCHGTQTQVPVLHTTALSCISSTLNSDAGGGPADNLSPRTMDATDKHSACQALPAFTSGAWEVGGHLWKLFGTRNDQAWNSNDANFQVEFISTHPQTQGL
ncbi:hypothetical protein Pelo_4876 [Pelomyxa schiedti]|nr:hypothetical protein Pelo_4876 [Pelomyxa schiedti]